MLGNLKKAAKVVTGVAEQVGAHTNISAALADRRAIRCKKKGCGSTDISEGPLVLHGQTRVPSYICNTCQTPFS